MKDTNLIRPLSIAEYESLRTEIMQDAEQKVTIQLALFTISVAIASAALITAAGGGSNNNEPNYWTLGWICNSSYLFVILMLCILGRKKRAISRCSAYLLVFYCLSTEQLEKFNNNSFEYSDFANSALPSWEINYRMAFRDIENNTDNKVFDNSKKDPLSGIRMKLSTFGYNHIGDCLAIVIIFSTFICLKSAGLPFGITLSDLYFWSPAILSATIGIVIIGTNFIQSQSKKSKARNACCVCCPYQSEQLGFQLFYKLSGQDFVFAQFAALFLQQRLKKINR